LPDVNSDLKGRLAKGLLDLIVMALISSSSSFGAYDLIGLIRADFEVMVSPGVIYPVLFTLEREGLLRTRWKQRKKVYELTEEGQRYVAKLTKAYADAHRKVLSVLERQKAAVQLFR